jgi:hypothetical protein
VLEPLSTGSRVNQCRSPGACRHERVRCEGAARGLLLRGASLLQLQLPWGGKNTQTAEVLRSTASPLRHVARGLRLARSSCCMEAFWQMSSHLLPPHRSWLGVLSSASSCCLTVA